MTVTNALTTQSIGTSTNIGEGKFPQKVTANTTSSGFFIGLKVTNGADSYKQINELRCWYTSSSFSLTAAAAVATFKRQARYVDLRFGKDGGDIRAALSELEVLAGQYIYFWFDIPSLDTAATLAADCVEV